jgi:fermentation-respiration switch protein FrsA (DUF1100 family)
MAENEAPSPAAVKHEDLGSDKPLPAEEDPFFEPPLGYERAHPGTVLRSRSVELGLFGVVPLRINGTQLLYRTTNLHGDAEAAVTTVLVPLQRDPRRLCPILSYQCAIDAVDSRCFPSYALRRGAGPGGGPAQGEFLFITAALAEGWAVSVPDHEGCHGMWGAPREPGYRILDGLRAATSSQELGLSASAPMGLWGYSGGGLASAWANELWASYAPELNIVGSALGAPVGDLESVTRRLNGTFFAGLAALMISALTDVFPAAQSVVDQHATAGGKALLSQLREMSTGEAIWRLRHNDIGSYVDMSADELWDLPELRHIFEETKLGKHAPESPTLVIQGVRDEIISVNDIDELVQTYSSAGAAVVYHRDRLCGHLLLYPLSAPMALQWLNDRFAGIPLIEEPVPAEWSVLLKPSTYLGMLKIGLATAKVIAGRA